MILTTPIAPADAIRLLTNKKVTSTNMSSAEMRAMWRGAMESVFSSAHTLLESVLDDYKAAVGSILHPTQTTRADRITEANPEGNVTVGLNPATVRVKIKESLKDAGYRPAADEVGTIKDLSSDARINLVVKTQTEMAQGYGHWRQGQDEAILDQWPAQELIRVEDRDKKRDWNARFRLAGDATGLPIGAGGWTITPDKRMIALKNHPIWEKLGDSTLFDDGLDNPYPPFAFNSGMDVQDVDRGEAEDLGLITPDQKIEPQVRPFEIQTTA